MRPREPALRRAVGFTALLLTAWLAGGEAAVFEDMPKAPDFSLARAAGGEYRLHSRPRGAVLLYFGFTNCPHVCPHTMATLSRLSARLTEAERSRVDLIFVSVDPERDTPAQVRKFLSRFNGDFIGLIPNSGELERLTEDYNLVTRKLREPGRPDYDVLHTDLVYLVGPAGKLRHAYFAGTPTDAILGDLRDLLCETP